MYIKDGIAYAGEMKPALKVSGVRPLSDYRLWVRFNTGEAKVYDCKPLLGKAGFAPLNDIAVFNGAYIDYGIVVWLNGDIDISPNELYENGIIAEYPETA